MAHRLPSWLVGLLLAAPLVVLTLWVARSVAPADPTAAVAASLSPAPRPEVLPGLPPPQADLPEDRLEEQVNGAADALRAGGCRRLLYWRFEDPPADAEVLIFRSAEDAHAVMEKEAGPDRTPGPGEEAQVTGQSVYFRRGAAYVRVFLDPGAERQGFVECVAAIDRALAAGDPL